MRVPLLALLLLPSLAAAQGLQLSFADVAGGAPTDKLTTNDCARTVRMQYSGVVLGGVGIQRSACGNLQVWASEGTCGNEPGTATVLAEVDLTTAQAQSSGTFEFKVSQLPLTEAGGACGAEQVEKALKLCGAYESRDALFGTNCDETTKVGTAPVLTFDNLPPAAPAIAGVTPLDRELRVTVTAGEGEGVRVEKREVGTEAWSAAGAVGKDVRTLSITGLTNGTTYELQAFATDAAGNESPASAAATGTPIETVGFWGAYKAAGGQETGGCAAAGGALAPLGALAMLFLRRRRS